MTVGDKWVGDPPFWRGSPGKHKGEFPWTLTVNIGVPGENRSLIAGGRLGEVGEFLKTPCAGQEIPLRHSSSLITRYSERCVTARALTQASALTSPRGSGEGNRAHTTRDKPVSTHVHTNTHRGLAVTLLPDVWVLGFGGPRSSVICLHHLNPASFTRYQSMLKSAPGRR